MCMPSNTKPAEDQQGRSRSKASSTLRRHKTLPGPLRSFPTNGSSSRRFQPDGRTNNFTMLRLSKSNPYVGWFRHAPPMISLQNLTAEATEWLQQYHLQKNIPNATTIRAATPLLLLRRCTSSITSHKVPSCQRLLSAVGGGGVEPTVAVYRALKLHHLRQPDLTAGMLLGGTTVEELGATTKNTKIITSSNVLSNIACWLLDVSLLTENPPSLQELGIVPTITEKKKCSSSGSSSCGKSATADSADSSLLSSQDNEDDDDDELTMESRDEQEQHSPHSTTTTRPPIADDDGRLDYNITQMDIVRMNRIASRHLDVESIFNLPTVTYQPPGSHPATTDTTNAPKDDDNSFSWMLVHSDSEASEADGCGEAQHRRVDPDSADGCIICLEEFTAGDRLRILPCQHKFHISCIDRWLSGVHSDDFCITSGCPTCKTVPTSTTLTMNSNLNESSVVPGWAFARIGDALIRESQHLG